MPKLFPTRNSGVRSEIRTAEKRGLPLVADEGLIGLGTSVADHIKRKCLRKESTSNAEAC